MVGITDLDLRKVVKDELDLPHVPVQHHVNVQYRPRRGGQICLRQLVLAPHDLQDGGAAEELVERRLVMVVVWRVV